MKKRRGCLHSLFIWLLIAAILVGFWYFENNVIQTEELTVSSPRLPPAFDGLRVVAISDLHGKQFKDGSEALLEAVEQAKPDVIALTGDLADEDTDLSVIGPLVQGLVKLAPTYYVTGNHEWVMDDLSKLLDILEDAGVRVLHNEFVLLSRGDASIVLAGVDDPNGPYDQKTPAELMTEIRAACGEGAYVLMLAHRNDRLSQWAELGVDTVLSGHGHGGVIRIPFVGGLVGVDRELLPDFTAGLYTQDGTTMAVSRGLGNSVVDMRLFNRPHLPVVILKRG